MMIEAERANSKRQRAFVWGVVLCWSLLLIPMAHSPKAENIKPSVPNYGYKVIRVFPHDPEAFTQGLIFHQGILYESTGLIGKSSLREVDIKTVDRSEWFVYLTTFSGKGSLSGKTRSFN